TSASAYSAATRRRTPASRSAQSRSCSQPRDATSTPTRCDAHSRRCAGRGASKCSTTRHCSSTTARTRRSRPPCSPRPCATTSPACAGPSWSDCSRAATPTLCCARWQRLATRSSACRCRASSRWTRRGSRRARRPAASTCASRARSISTSSSRSEGMKKVRLGLSGLGSLSQRGILPHLAQPDAQETIELAAVCDVVAERAEETARRYDVERHFSSFDQMLEVADLDAVAIAGPIPVHYEQTMKALAAGKHVYVQKAMTTTLDEANDVVEARKRAGVKLVASPGQMLDGIHQ